MAKQFPLIPIEELKKMTPEERLELHRERTILDWEDVPADLRERSAATLPPDRSVRPLTKAELDELLRTGLIPPG